MVVVVHTASKFVRTVEKLLTPPHTPNLGPLHAPDMKKNPELLMLNSCEEEKEEDT